MLIKCFLLGYTSAVSQPLRSPDCHGRILVTDLFRAATPPTAGPHRTKHDQRKQI